MFRLRTLLALLMIGAAAYFGAPMLLKGMVQKKIVGQFAALGYTNPRYDLTAFGWGGMTLENIQLEPEGISTIDRIDISYTPLGLANGMIDQVRIIHPDLIYSTEDDAPAATPKSAPLPRSAIWSFSLQDVPIRTLEIEDMNLSYASDEINPSLSGKISLLTDTDQTRKLVANLKSEQKELSLTINATLSETPARVKTIHLDIPEARLDLPRLRLTRGNAKLDMTMSPQAPVSIQGELLAGAMKIGDLPLDGLTVTASGQKPDLNIIGNAGVTGIPMTNVSLRVSETAKGAQLLWQLSGEAPKALVDALAPTLALPLPAQQKFALALDVNATNFFGLLKPPYQAGVFLYLDGQDPLLRGTLSCPETLAVCDLKLPETPLSAAQVTTLAEPLLAAQGLTLTDGAVQLSASARLADNKIETSLLARSENLDLMWQNLKLSDAQLTLTRSPDGLLTLSGAQATALQGTLAIDKLTMTPRGEGSGVIKIDNIDLGDLGRLASVSGLDLSGKLAGTLPLSLRAGEWVAGSDARLTSAGGMLHYAPASYPSFLAGDDERLDTLRQALHDYAFDELSLAFSGPLTGEIKVTLAAKGRNENLFGDRPIHINLNIEGPLAPTLRHLLPTFTALTTATPDPTATDIVSPDDANQKETTE